MKNFSNKNPTKRATARLAVIMARALGAASAPASPAFANPNIPLGIAKPGQPIPRVVVTAKRMTDQQKAEFDAELRTKRAEKQKTSRAKQGQCNRTSPVFFARLVGSPRVFQPTCRVNSRQVHAAGTAVSSFAPKVLLAALPQRSR